MWVRFTRDMGRYEAGQKLDLPAPLARRAVRIKRAERVERGARVETATRGAPENAADRTEPPETAICGYETQAGGVCSRRVGSGRCWQHEED